MTAEAQTLERLQAEIDRLIDECQKRNTTIGAQRDELSDREATILNLRREIVGLRTALTEACDAWAARDTHELDARRITKLRKLATPAFTMSKPDEEVAMRK